MKKTVKIILSFFLIATFTINLNAQEMMHSLEIGKVQIAQGKIANDKQMVPLIKIDNLLYILDDDLLRLGFEIQKTEQCYIINEAKNATQVDEINLLEDAKSAYSINKPIYLGNKRSHLLQADSHLYIPFNLLVGYYQFEEKDEIFYIKEKFENYYMQTLRLSDEGIENIGDYCVNLICNHCFWHENTWDIIEENIVIEPQQFYKWQVTDKGIYVGTQIKVINGFEVPMDNQTNFEEELPFYRAYYRAQRREILEKKFPTYIIEAKMRYGIGPLKKDQIVNLIRSEKHAYFWVKDLQGEKVKVPFGSVQIIGEKGAALPRVSTDEIQEYANLIAIESETPYLLWTDVYRQRTYVLEKKEGMWQHLYTFVCSTGKNVNPTPTGVYKVQYAIPYFGMGKGYRCKYALVFFQDYMYHSILFDRTGQYIKSGQYELGSKASHGCVRLSEKDSNWLYEHIPVKTTVWIR